MHDNQTKIIRIERFGILTLNTRSTNMSDDVQLKQCIAESIAEFTREYVEHF